ncbi:ferric reductase-like transmembrane domain-containing protein [Candidatus Dojkabacteria bacterium]|uniref:Ferric reductase-like transmembrane domain-containing protein n=1 Tax=Candidatus Dojkabacteria bacterium TaxID=2099670 RepID=A0A955L8J9_9BACT|nr:ferric reductase-like transmembrane domain-containing protein [Candidatus Dojkabacteria bacterium]
MFKKGIGKILVVFILSNTVLLWILSKAHPLEYMITEPFKALSQVSALIATLLLSFDYILATRLKFIEDLFNGLDKVYRLHHIYGGIAFILFLFHPVFLAVQALPNVAAAKLFFLPGSSLAYNLGIYALFSFTVLLITTFYIKLPYHIWKFTHDFMGIPLLFVSAHIFFITSDTSRSIVLRYWIFFFLFLAILSYIYKRFIYGKFTKRYTYTITSIIQDKSILDIVMKPVSQKLHFKAGQFIFIQFTSKNLSSELHPFSISSAPEEDEIRLSVKMLGDFTVYLPDIKKGQNVTILGPHGIFGDVISTQPDKNYVWVGGGIGVTPFLSLLRHKITNSQQELGKIWFFYCTRDQEEAKYDKEIRSMMDPLENCNYYNFCSSTQGHLDSKVLEQEAGELTDKIFLLCGPVRMMHDLADQLMKKGVKAHNIIFEEFNFLSS